MPKRYIRKGGNMKKKQLVISYEIPEKNELMTQNALLADNENQNDSSSMFKWYYISDLHLMHKIQKLKHKSEQNVRQMIDQMIEEMLPSFPLHVLIGGDVSSDYKVFEYFARRLSQQVRMRTHFTEVYFVLGNHELWSFPNKKYEEIVEIYDKLLSECGMHLLKNELIYYEKCCSWIPQLLTEEKLLNGDRAELREITRKASVFLLGGMAFSGKNESFNANNGIYGGVISRKREIEESNRFFKLYAKVKDTFYDKQLIVFTHMPIAEWADKEEYHPGFVYVSGHTHKNMLWDDGTTKIYADNQVGYEGQHARLKRFQFINQYDYFSDYKDGIYNVTVDEYVAFCQGMSRPAKCNREHKRICMLKKGGYYCFIMESKKGDLFIMNGGQIKRLERRDVEYYYDNMDSVIARLREPIERFNRILRKVSDDVKRFGGDGRIHGCIVDISFREHIFVNPFDLTTTAYYADSTVEKWIYPSVPALLYDKCPHLYEKYRERMTVNPNDPPTVVGNPNEDLSVPPKFAPDTEMYRVSNEILKMQRLDSKVLNTWNEGRGSVLGIENH